MQNYKLGEYIRQRRLTSKGRAHRGLGRGNDVDDLILRVNAVVLPRCGSVRSIGFCRESSTAVNSCGD